MGLDTKGMRMIHSRFYICFWDLNPSKRIYQKNVFDKNNSKGYK